MQHRLAEGHLLRPMPPEGVVTRFDGGVVPPGGDASSIPAHIRAAFHGPTLSVEVAAVRERMLTRMMAMREAGVAFVEDAIAGGLRVVTVTALLSNHGRSVARRRKCDRLLATKPGTRFAQEHLAALSSA